MVLKIVLGTMKKPRSIIENIKIMIDYKIRELVILNYIKAYNAFDVPGMVKDMDPSLLFENISNGHVNMSLQGIESFKNQAEQALDYFSSRNQDILSIRHENEQSIVEIAYEAKLAMDFPNGLKKGNKIQFKGQSIFRFTDNDRIIHLTDIS
jgi:hypothetical protein